MNRIYLDHAATTALDPLVFEAMLPWLTGPAANASSSHSLGREARAALDEARRSAAKVLNAKPREIYFTSGGTESDNWAIRGAKQKPGCASRHLITSAVEHHAVLHAAEAFEAAGGRVTILPVDRLGRVSPADAEAAFAEDTALVSIMLANNETGTIQPVRAIADAAHAHGITVHTDAVQAPGSLSLDVEALGVDQLSLSAHKFGGPKGTGLLYIREGCVPETLLAGGAQERGRRGGTENIAGIVGLAKALTLADAAASAHRERLLALRERFLAGVYAAVPGVVLNGDPENTLPGHINLRFDGVRSDALLVRLDLAGICASGGSACTAGSPEPSHVLLAMGLSRTEARSSVRFTLGAENTEAEIDTAIRVIADAVRAIRS